MAPGARMTGRVKTGAGTLRRTVTTLASISAPDGTGGNAIAYVPDTDIWAMVRRLSSVGDVAGDRAIRLRRLSVTIRRTPDLHPGSRLRFDGDDYEITSIEDADDQALRLTLICEEVA